MEEKEEDWFKSILVSVCYLRGKQGIMYMYVDCIVLPARVGVDKCSSIIMCEIKFILQSSQGVIAGFPGFTRSEGVVIAWVVSKHVVKFNVVDFVCSLSHESLENNTILLVRHLHTEVVEDWLETCEGNKSRSVTILILEVWLDQKTTVFHISAQTLETSDQNLLLRVIQNVLGIQDWGCIESVRFCRWVLFKCFIREDSI